MKVKQLRKLMKPQYIFGREEWNDKLGIDVGKASEECVLPWDENIFESIAFRNGQRFACFIPKLIEGVPLTIPWWHAFLNQRSNGFKLDPLAQWVTAHPLTARTAETRWYMLMAHVDPKLVGFCLEKQKKDLDKEYEVHPAIIEVTKNNLFFLNMGFFPNKNRLARCSDVDPYGCVTVGKATKFIFGIGRNNALCSEPNTGLAASLKRR